MRLIYVDDSGDAGARTLSAISIPEDKWSEVMGKWLRGRWRMYQAFGVHKNQELHANELLKGRGRFCETPTQESRFHDQQRVELFRSMLKSLATVKGLETVTITEKKRTLPDLYGTLLDHLETSLAAAGEYGMICFDGKESPRSLDSADPSAALAAHEDALRDSQPYRARHRALDLNTRRVIEDMHVQDSKYSQLIQAVDLMAYAAFHAAVRKDPTWFKASNSLASAADAHAIMSRTWNSDLKDGILWVR